MPSLEYLYMTANFISFTLGDVQSVLLISEYMSRMKVVVVTWKYVYFAINRERVSKNLIEPKSISKHSTCALTCDLRLSILDQYVFIGTEQINQRRQWQPTPVLLPGKSHGRRSLVGYSPWGLEESGALEKEMATHSSVLAWRIPGMGEPARLPSVGSHRVGCDWSDLAAAGAAAD